MRGYERGYDYGLRGFRETAEWRDPVRMRFVGGRYDAGLRDALPRRAAMRAASGYGGEYREHRARGYGGDYGYGAEPFNRVTARYNRDYVWDRRPSDHPVNYAPYGGDRIGRIGDPREYHAPYQTTGGTRTWRGEWPMGWERERARYGGDFPRPRSDLGRWFQD
jgi:hypothetical protein